MDAHRKPSIIVVDDDKDNLEITARGLIQSGYKVHKFSDPILALQHIEHDSCKDCDVLISDVNMPAMNGFQLVRRIKELRSGTKIVLMTGFDINKHEFETVFPSTPVDQIIRKPFALSEFVQRIEEIQKEVKRKGQDS
jgi:two-component system OmpR family response regulator